MISVTVEKAAGILQQLVYDTINNCEETVIVSDNGSVVMIDQAEWNNIQETLRILSDKKALRSLLDGHEIRKQGGRPDGVGIEEAFSDIQNHHSEKGYHENGRTGNLGLKKCCRPKS